MSTRSPRALTPDDAQTVLRRARVAQAAIDAVLSRDQQQRELVDDAWRVRCSDCGRVVSSPLPVPVIVRAHVVCEECLARGNDDPHRDDPLVGLSPLEALRLITDKTSDWNVPTRVVMSALRSLEGFGRRGLVVSVACGPSGDVSFRWSVQVLVPTTGEEFDRPFAATSFVQAVAIAGHEIATRGWEGR